jgi:hypothetical protein
MSFSIGGKGDWKAKRGVTMTYRQPISMYLGNFVCTKAVGRYPEALSVSFLISGDNRCKSSRKIWTLKSLGCQKVSLRPWIILPLFRLPRLQVEEQRWLKISVGNPEGHKISKAHLGKSCFDSLSGSNQCSGNFLKGPSLRSGEVIGISMRIPSNQKRGD